MHYKNYKLDDVIKNLSKSSHIALLSDTKSYSRNSKIIMVNTNNDYSNLVGKEIGAIFVDVRYSNKYTLDTLHYLLTRVRGDTTNLFPDKVYFTGDIMTEGFTFSGKLNFYESWGDLIWIFIFGLQLLY